MGWPRCATARGHPTIVPATEVASTAGGRQERSEHTKHDFIALPSQKRTLTPLDNQRPTWLANLRAALDRAVWSAYGWDDPDPAEVPDDEILARLLALNLERAGTGASSVR